MTQPKKKKQSFEEALKQLEKIVSEVEEGKIGLEESIDKHEQGMKLIQYCRSILQKAEERIETAGKINHPNSGSSQ